VLFRLFKRKKENIQIGEILKVDIHSHILPNIDDGAKDIEESIELIEALSKLGYKKLIATPHVMNEGYRNSSQKIVRTLETVKRETTKREIDIELAVAAEYYMDDGLDRLIEQNDILTLCGSYILFETSYINPPLNFKETIFQMKLKGHNPLLAHPERYHYIDNSYEILEEWRDFGISFQVEINSFTGYYGKAALNIAVWLSQKGWIDFLATDTHSIRHIKAINKWRYDIEKVLLENNIKNSYLC